MQGQIGRVRSLAEKCGIGAILVISACSSKETPQGVAVISDSSGIAVVENRVGLSTDSCHISPEPRVRIGAVTGAGEYQLYSVSDATVLSDGAIAVLNRGTSEVRIYEPDGTFRRAFGREGQGPGEFRNVGTIDVLPGDTLVVGDYRPWRYQWFTEAGEYVRSMTPEPEFINVPWARAWLAPSVFVLGSRCCPPSDDRYVLTTLTLLRFSAEGQPLGDTIGEFPFRREGWLDRSLGYRGFPLFGAQTRVAGANGWLYIGTALEREIDVRDRRGSLVRLIRWTGPDRTVPPSAVEAYRQELLADRSEVSAGLHPYIEARASKDRPVSDRFPAHGVLLAGRGGDLWIHEYPRPDRPDQARSWLVFDPEGRFQCHADIPEGITPFEIGADFLLAEVTDDLDVEYVVRYPLRRPPQ